MALMQYVAGGTASNGHTHYWAVCRGGDDHTWESNFRSTIERADEDLARHIAQKHQEPVSAPPKGARTIYVTRAEFDALVSAAALHEAEYDGQGGKEERRARRVDAHLTDVIRRWREA